MSITYPKDNRPTRIAMLRGFKHRCPNCGKGPMFWKYLKVVDTCSYCAEDLSHQRADDAPPYFTIFIVGHIILPLALMSEKIWQLSTTTHLVLWLPSILILSLVLLPCVKGAVVGLQWSLHMHGFGGDTDEPPLLNTKVRGT